VVAGRVTPPRPLRFAGLIPGLACGKPALNHPADGSQDAFRLPALEYVPANGNAASSRLHRLFHALQKDRRLGDPAPARNHHRDRQAGGDLFENGEVLRHGNLDEIGPQFGGNSCGMTNGTVRSGGAVAVARIDHHQQRHLPGGAGRANDTQILKHGGLAGVSQVDMKGDTVRAVSQSLLDRPDQDLVVGGRPQLTGGRQVHEDPGQPAVDPCQEPEHALVENQGIGAFPDTHSHGFFRAFQTGDRPQADAVVQRQDYHPTAG